MRTVMKSKIIIPFLLVLNIYLFWSSKKNPRDIQQTIEELKSINDQLRNWISNCSGNQTEVAPSLQYEKKRRRIFTTIRYMWDNVRLKIKMLKIRHENESTIFDDLRRSIYEHKISLLSDWKQMSLNDNYESWRQEEATKLEELAQKRFHYSQNPSNCDSAKYLRCTGEWTCGWGCQLERYAECMAIAFGLQRVLSFYKGPQFFYEPDEYTRYYKPTSENCTQINSNLQSHFWPGTPDSKVIKTPDYLRDIKPHMKYLFVAIPADLAPRLEKIFEEPTAWWLAQVEKYLTRLKEDTSRHINDVAKKLGFKKPIVGVHVRRTDKIKEVAYQPLENYMEEVAEYYDQLELTEKVEKRSIFLSTEEPNIIKEIMTKYPSYEILVDEDATKQSHSLGNRYKSSLGILTNSRLLAQCDYFVGTFSSNIGRRSYEFMYWNYADAAERYKSLDTRHFEVCENPQTVKAVLAHEPRDSTEIAIHVGQELNLLYQYNPINVHGVSKVQSRDKSSEGYVPSFKIEKVIELVDFPTYSEVN